ncbi:MAG TPA: glutaredoxin domain-containing protein [Candidatus Paceibacterota bacterium]|nr:glutaredoxin domain-containing protein [Candidatus Paceibacterota bacterium]
MSKIQIYSTPTCTYCQLAKQFFGQNNVEYTEFDVAEDLEKRQEMIEKSGQMGVPVISIEKDGKSEVIVGFDEDRIRQILSI